MVALVIVLQVAVEDVKPRAEMRALLVALDLVIQNVCRVVQVDVTILVCVDVAV